MDFIITLKLYEDEVINKKIIITKDYLIIVDRLITN
jgi:hypothetical protein